MKNILLTLFLLLTAHGLRAQDVVVDHLLPGRLGITVLKQVDSFDHVESLTILSGKTNKNDWLLLRYDFPNLRKLDLAGLDCEYIEISTSDTPFGRKDSLTTLILPQNLRYVNQNFISGCKKVTDIDIPASVVHIASKAFYESNLQHVTLHEGLLTIGSAAFGYCQSLEHVTLPSTLLAVSAPFSHSNNILSVTSLAPTPPTLVGDGLFGYNQTETMATLYTPPGSNYRAAKGWNLFANISETACEPVKDIRVIGTYVPYPYPANKPNVTLGVGMDSICKFYSTQYTQTYVAQMTAINDETLNLGSYNHELDIMGYRSRRGTSLIQIPDHHSSPQGEDSFWPSLVAKSPVTATDVSLIHRYMLWQYETLSPIWAFTSLPFDVRLSDLETEGPALQYSIMKYSGKMRADAKFDEVWVRQTADSTIHAGEGFIVAAAWDSNASQQASIRYKAPANQCTAIFNSDDAVIALHDYPAEFECDRGWNFVGNPYPCHFATKYFSLTVPFVVYRSGRFQTYSPIDDDYVLKPYEGFFIQKPWGHDALTLYKEGRFLGLKDYADFKQQNNAPRHAVAADRKVVNILITQGDEVCDNTRLVVNREAAADYEPMWDAVKFPAIDEQQTLLWLTGHDGTRYTISEQPLSEGDHIALDLRIATEGDYTLAFNGKDLSGLILIDLETGASQPLTEHYTFHATAGTHSGRFHICGADGDGEGTHQNGVATIDGIKYQFEAIGIASVEDITSDAETIEIPDRITYEGATYIVYRFTHYTNSVTYKHLILPATILSVTISRGNPRTLETVTVKSLCPPSGSYYSQSVRDTTDIYTWYVPKAALERYKSSPNYRSLPHILPMEEETPELWAHYGLVQFNDNTKPHNKPAFYAHQHYYTNFYNNTDESDMANIEVEGTQTMSLSSFEYFMHQPFFALSPNHESSGNSKKWNPSLITNSPMTADKVTTLFLTSQNDLYYWPMLCLPYDIRPSDITGDFKFFVPTVRLYDGARRAANGVAQGPTTEGYASNWKLVSTGETVPAGTGFILSAYMPSAQYTSSTNMVHLPALDNAQRNGIFATSRTITLTDYPSTRPVDRGWNLVGNAYPAYYDLSESDISTPYIVWGTKDQYNNSYWSKSFHYYAFTRDDDFLLLPFQGFFVQYTDTQHEIHLPGSGRYHDYTDFEARRPEKAPRLTNGNAPERHLFDIELTGCYQHDRTRVVLNDEASTGFEPDCDVVQIPVQGVSLLSTIDGGLRYAINERPMTQGSIPLALDIAEEGDYTLSLTKTNSCGLILTDHVTGRVTRLDEADYTFHAVTGRHDARFTLSFDGPTRIGDFTLRRTDGAIYDLQGRPVTGRPTKGIYIQNGKKVVIK